MNTYSYYLDALNEFGVVEQVTHPLCFVSGLPKAKPHEIVLLESGQVGEVYAVHGDGLEILLFSSDPVQVGVKLVRTNKTLTIPVGEGLLGHTINPLCESIGGNLKADNLSEEREIDIRPQGISERSRIKKQLRTGTIIVDMMVPLGRGQKELVIGDRKTGKSSFLFTAIKTQIAEGTIAIYAVIGKKKSYIKYLEETLKAQGLYGNMIMVVTSAGDSPSFIYLTPYTAMTIAEYFRDKGHNVLVVFDDLSTHAQYHREISLLAGDFPGRDSYPGDIFYTYARLLERSGNFIHPTKGEVSITSLPILETVEGDLTSYLATTLMGITDGHLFFDSNIFYNGRRPAVNLSVSVTRVGKQTQAIVKRDITRELTSFLSLYDKMQNFSHFGSELTDSVKNILATGDKLYEFFDQHYTMIVPDTVQLILFSLIWIKLLDSTAEELERIRILMIDAYAINSDIKQFYDELIHVDSFNGLLRNITKNKEKLFSLWNKKIN